MMINNIEFLDNSHISEPARELHSRAAPSIGGITAQSVQPQGEIPEEGRTKKNFEKTQHEIYVIQNISEKNPCHISLTFHLQTILEWLCYFVLCA